MAEQYRTLKDFFDPYNKEHVEAAMQYFTSTNFPDGFIPEDVVLSNHYGIREHLLSCMSAAWMIYKITGKEKPPVTH